MTDTNDERLSAATEAAIRERLADERYYDDDATPMYDVTALLSEIDALRAEMVTVRDELLSGNQYAAATRMRGWQLDGGV